MKHIHFDVESDGFYGDVYKRQYLSCSRLYNDYDGIQHDYTKKQGLLWQQDRKSVV